MRDPDKLTAEARSARLARRRRQFTYNYDHVAPLAISDDVPNSHEPSWAWWLMVLKAADELIDNTNAVADKDAAAQRGTAERNRRRQAHAQLRSDADAGRVRKRSRRRRRGDEEEGPSFAEWVRNLFGTPWQKLLSDAADRLAVGAVKGRHQSVEGFSRLFAVLPDPGNRTDILNDAQFAWMRVAGPNPTVITRLARLPERYPGQAEALRSAIALSGDSLDAALAQRRLYACDYSGLESLTPGTFPVAKHVPAPLALFVVPPGGRRLQPVGIQITQRPGRPVITPNQGWTWQCAKLAVQVADGNHHEAVAHLGRTHLLVEPFVVATERQLDETHPIYILLRPHFEGTLFINNSAHSAIIAPGGTVDRLMSGSIEASRKAAVEGLRAIPFDQGDLEQDLKRRGLADAVIEFPYRDDARLLHAALERWVTAYVGLYYRNDADVRADEELQAWAAELVSPRGGRVTGFGDIDGQITTRAYLVRALTQLIFTASVQHAAVNSPQYPIMSNASNYPLGLYGAPPEANATEAQFLALLPPREQALVQLNLGYLLGNIHYTELGQYDDDCFEDDRVAPLLAAFQGELAQAGDTIQARNAVRSRPYPFLHPSRVPQSINI